MDDFVRGRSANVGKYNTTTEKLLSLMQDCTDTGDGIPGITTVLLQTENGSGLSSIVNWDPIGKSGGQNLYFAGHYDGGGHTISNAKSTGKK